MTRFRCAIVDEGGIPATRIIDARSRDQALLLLLAQGLTPSSITRDAPSLVERISPATREGAADALLADLASLVASGFTIAEAAAAIDGEPARRIAAGAPVGEIMAGMPGWPRWIGAALMLASDNDEPGALIEIADDAATIALRARALRSAQVEAGLIATVATALIAAMIWVNVTIGLALCLAIYLALRHPFRAFRRSMHTLRQADFLLIVGRLLIAGAALRDSIRIAADDLPVDHEKTSIDAILTAQSNDADVRRDLGCRLGLSAADRAIMAHGDAARAARAVSVHLARSSMSARGDMLMALRMSFAVVTAVALIWLISR